MIGETNRQAVRLWDPADPAFRADPYPFYDRLRTEAPVYQAPGGPLVISRYDDVLRVLRSNSFSRDIEANARIDETDLIAVRRRDRRGGAKTILNLDPPDHTRLRRLVSKAFTPRAIDRLRPRIEVMVDAVLDRAAEQGEIELVDELAFPVPFQVISELLDMPTERADELRSWSQALTLGLEPGATIDDLDAAEAAIMQLIPYLVAIIDARRAAPGEDLLSGLLAVEDEGDTLSPAELIAFVVLLYVAGHETTVNLIGNGTLALLRNPDELRRARRVTDRRAAALRRAGSAHGARADGTGHVHRFRRRDDHRRTRRHRADGARRGQPRPAGLRGAARAAAGSSQRSTPPCVLDRHPLLPWRVAGEARGDDRDRSADPALRLDRARRSAALARPSDDPRRRPPAAARVVGAAYGFWSRCTSELVSHRSPPRSTTCL
jgi:cytochrome P450